MAEQRIIWRRFYARATGGTTPSPSVSRTVDIRAVKELLRSFISNRKRSLLFLGYLLLMLSQLKVDMKFGSLSTIGGFVSIDSYSQPSVMTFAHKRSYFTFCRGHLRTMWNLREPSLTALINNSAADRPEYPLLIVSRGPTFGQLKLSCKHLDTILLEIVKRQLVLEMWMKVWITKILRIISEYEIVSASMILCGCST